MKYPTTEDRKKGETCGARVGKTMREREKNERLLCSSRCRNSDGASASPLLTNGRKTNQRKNGRSNVLPRTGALLRVSDQSGEKRASRRDAKQTLARVGVLYRPSFPLFSMFLVRCGHPYDRLG